MVVRLADDALYTSYSVPYYFESLMGFQFTYFLPRSLFYGSNVIDTEKNKIRYHTSPSFKQNHRENPASRENTNIGSR